MTGLGAFTLSEIEDSCRVLSRGELTNVLK